MVFFKTKDDPTDNWKEKYLNLLDNQEQVEQAQRASEDLLCKTIMRFALAVKGFNKNLDPHLDRIRETLKSRLQSDQLKQELQSFSNALMALEDEPQSSQLSAALLFDFLSSQYPHLQDSLNQIQHRYDNRQLANHQRLFLALAELIAPQPAPQPPYTEVLDAAECKDIRQQLIRLLDAVELPASFIDDASQLKTRLQSGQAVTALFDDAVTLLLAVKNQMDAEHQELTSFLATLTIELTELGVKASGVNLASEDVAKKRANLDRDLSSQMADLQKKSATATQLEPLKQLIHFRLASIGQQINNHNLQEQTERSRVQNELRSLTQKLRDMEAETSELQQKLELAQRRASHDHLTGLPNRQAFSDRLGEEMARTRRHASPLSLAVWDIDFFKNINDTYGHKSGDKALTIIAKLLSQHCRKSDFLARYGGEEFVMLFPETLGKDALIVANKLREAVESSSFNANGHRVQITLSCGITEHMEGDNGDSIFERADNALYTAKQTGRNKCVLA